MTDEELAAEARRVGYLLSRCSGDVDRYAAELLRQLADRLDAAQATEDVHVIREGTIAGPLILDPRYTPPWPSMRPHGYDPDSHIPGNSCTYCGRGQDDPLHAAAGEGFTPRTAGADDQPR